MENTSLKVLGTFAAGAAVAASIQTIAFADPVDSSTLTSRSATTGIVIADALNVRSKPDASSTSLGLLKQNTKISIIEITNGWCKIIYNSSTGWISKDYIKLETSNSTIISTGIVKADSLNVRANASTNSKILGSLSNGTKVEILSTSNGWHKIEFNGGTGYVSADYITLNSSQVQTTSTGTVKADALNVRANASTNSSIIGSLSNGTKVEILSTSNGWHKIKFNGGIGYVSVDYITLTQNSIPSQPTQPDNNQGSSNETIISTGTVKADTLNVRASASTNSSIIGSLSNGTKVEILSTSNGWHKIKFNGGIGYVSVDYIKINSNNNESDSENSPSHNVTGKVAIVTADALNIRSGAGTNYSIVATARYGSKLPIISYTNGWYYVKSGSTTGYVSEDYVTVANEGDTINPLVKETPLIESAYTGEDIAAEAEKYLGVPYLWGGFTPVGFDCSGLVQYVYKQFGISVERTTYYQVHQGQIVDRNDLRPGDLIFFTTNENDPNDISHVGIYKGNDLFIHAPKPGDVVRISNLNSSYYSNNYYVAKRIIK